jgi:hypothetical protein
MLNCCHISTILLPEMRKRSKPIIFIGLSLGGIPSTCKFANIAEYELKIDGSNYIIILDHDLCIRWSEFFGYPLQQEIKIVLQILARLEISRNSVVLKFHLS